MNRIDRLSAILIHLQSKKVVTAAELAKRFEISKRTVYRDIKALEEGGVPVGGEAGLGYYIVDSYHLPPVMFTREEAGAFLLGGKLIEKHSDLSVKTHFDSGLFKIRSVLETTDKSYMENIERHINVYKFSPKRKEDFPNNFITDTLSAISENRILKLEYFAAYKDETLCRQVEPLALVHYSMHWHLIAFCKMRNDYRDFRLDRIKSLSKSEQIFSRKKDADINQYFNKLMDSSDLKKVTVRFSNKIIEHIQHSRYYYGFMEELERPDYSDMIFLVNSLDYLASWLITLGVHVKYTDSEELKLLLVAKVQELKSIYLD